jgi:hypothetical protein
MAPQNECVERVKEMVAEVTREKADLVQRLNAMHQRIEQETDTVTKVLRKVEWMEEKERSVEALNKIVASLQLVLDGSLEADDLSGDVSPATTVEGCRDVSSASSRQVCRGVSSASRQVSDTDDTSISEAVMRSEDASSTAPRPPSISRSIFQRRTSSMYSVFGLRGAHPRMPCRARRAPSRRHRQGGDCRRARIQECRAWTLQERRASGPKGLLCSPFRQGSSEPFRQIQERHASQPNGLQIPTILAANVSPDVRDRVSWGNARAEWDYCC